MLYSIVKSMMIKVFSKIPYLRTFVKFHVKHIDIIDSLEQCERVSFKFQKSSSHLPIIGLDCEWVTENDVRKPVALLQIADNDGMCSLIRLSKFKTIPSSLSTIISDSSIIKVGVAISDDAHLLMNDYNIRVSGYIDLRYLARECSLPERSLGALAYRLLGCQLDKDWRVRASNWDADFLTDRQVEYAALDAYIAIKILERLRNKKLSWWSLLFLTEKQKWDKFLITYSKYIDVPFKNCKSSNGNTNFKSSKSNVRPYSTLTIKAAKVYDNCLMENIDGSVMSSCSLKKVDWYINQGLAELVNENPRTIRLNFPAVLRKQNDKFSVHAREHVCCVCGRTERFVKKSIIPKEFIRHMPTVYKSHVTHDTLLLCVWCHAKSSAHDTTIRKKLYDMCRINEKSLSEYHQQQQVPAYKRIMRSKNIAKTLLKSPNDLPDLVVNKLKSEIAKTYNMEPDRVYNSFLKIVLTIRTLRYTNNVRHNSAAEGVVKHFLETDAISELKAIWRQHFLDTMKPKYLPPLWSVTYDG